MDKPDEYYLGQIPPTISKDELIRRMAKGILKFHIDNDNTMGETLKEIGNILDLWFDHDANRENNFDYLVTEYEFDDFIKEVVKDFFYILSEKNNEFDLTNEYDYYCHYSFF
jgi:hypothetical protein